MWLGVWCYSAKLIPVVSVGALRIPDTSGCGGDHSPPVPLLNRFVSCEDSDLRLAGSDAYLAEVLPRDQHRHYNGDTDNDQGDNHRLLLLHSLLLLDPKVGKRLIFMCRI